MILRDYFVIATISVLILVFAFWANFTQLDMVTIGSGRVIAAGQNQKIQAFENSTVTRVLVKENDTVRQGDIIIETNPVEIEGAFEEVSTRIKNLQLKLIRLDAELKNETKEQLIDKLTGFASDLSRSEISLFKARRESLETKIEEATESKKILEEQLLVLKEEAAGTLYDKRILEKEMSEIIPLVNEGVLSSSEKYRLEKEKNKLETNFAVNARKQEAFQVEIEKSMKKLSLINKEYLSQILKEKTESLASISELRARMPVIEQKLKQTEIKSPIDGTINQLTVNTLGAVLRKGDLIAEIVPSNTALRIEAFIDPASIATVEPGQKARISLTAYDPGRYGYLNGTVLQVSADTEYREEMNSFQYAVQLEIDIDDFLTRNNQVSVFPGLVAQVNIIRGKRTIFEYLWQPISKTKDTAFRE